MDKIKEMLKNKKVLTGAAAGLAVVVILIIIIAVSCSKNDNAGKGTSKTTAKEDITTVKKAEKETADEQNTTEPDTELSEEETTEGSTETAETETTEQPTTEIAENITTNVNIQTEPVTDAPASTETPTINITAEVPPTEAPTPAPAPEEPATERTTEVATLAGCGNRECSNIIYLGDEININTDSSSGADVCPFKLYDLNNLATYKYTNGNGYYVTFVGYYGLHCYSDYDGSIMELEYNYAADIVKSYGYGSLEDFEAAAEKLKTNTAATSAIRVGNYMNIPSTIDAEEAKEADFWASLGQEYDYEIHGGGIEFYGLYMLEY